MSKGEKNNEGFVLVKSHNKGRGKKKTLEDKQDDSSFNRFEALEDLDQ